MGTLLLYVSVVLIWGTTWFALQFQMGVVAPEYSVAYRFALAAAIMFAWARVRGSPMRFDARTQLGFALMGVLMFSTNFVLFYLAAPHVTSGLLAVIFSGTVLANLGWAVLLLKLRPGWPLLIGALAGVTGMGLVFWHEIAGFSLHDDGAVALALGVGGMLSFSAGNIVSARLQARGIPIVPSAAYSMLYGCLFMVAVALLQGKVPSFDPSWPYLVSLAYLTLFGSVAAFGCYLALLGRIGPAPAGYATVLFPVVALAISTALEGFAWTAASLLGVGLTLFGNLLILSRPKTRPAAAIAKT